MTGLLVKLFIKDSENILDEGVRGQYGTLSSVVGIVSNIILFILKFIMGTLSGSVSIVSDAFNNLSDCGSCLITLFGYKMATKPADKDHPFGHGRLEYLISFVVAAVIMFVGAQLFGNSVKKVIHPEPIVFSWIVLISLIISILVKIWMSLFNKKLGNKINSPVMLATSKDSANDVIATFATLIALVCSLFTTLPIDGIMGCIVSVIILLAGFEIIKETVDELLGKPADPQIVSMIKEILMADEAVLGIHDMLIHSYGPGVIFGSVHAEVDANQNILEIHDAIDDLERKVYDDCKVVLTVHMDPVEVDNEQVMELKNMIAEMLAEIDETISFHDFRVVFGNTHTNLIFDVLIPFDYKYSEEEIKQMINEKLSTKETKYYAVITVDRDFTGH